ncbi:MAG TPA: ATP-dependent sacrificial sulfur transferase LarE, partial [Actinomycetota bacterium]
MNGDPEDQAHALDRRLQDRIHAYGSTQGMVAFSGGVDSSTVLAVAARALGHRFVTAVTAISPSYPEGELEQAAELAASMGVRHRVIRTHEVDREAYARNDPDRCFHCKTELYTTIGRIVKRAGGEGAVVMAGANADDLLDVRPGLRAGQLRGVRNPLLEEGAGKEAVRALAQFLGLPVADKPALACLSSRVTFGVRITPELLARIDRAERLVRALGFDPVRVRHLGETASIEVPAGE